MKNSNQAVIADDISVNPGISEQVETSASSEVSEEVEALEQIEAADLSTPVSVSVIDIPQDAFLVFRFHEKENIQAYQPLFEMIGEELQKRGRKDVFIFAVSAGTTVEVFPRSGGIRGLAESETSSLNETEEKKYE